MVTYNPVTALIIFFALIIVLYFLFRPHKGLYYLLKKTYQSKEKMVIEDILKLLYHSQSSNKELTIIDLTNSLQESNSLLVDCTHKMIVTQLIFMKGDRFILSETGNEYALRIIRSHRLWEKFLSEKTGFDKKEWHHLAEKKEHELSVEQTEQLASLLGNPKFDPHGDPIPTSTGKMAHKNGVILSGFPINTLGKIVHIEDEPDIIYKQILAENIHLGSHLRVVENNATRVVFHSEGEKFVLAPIVAGNISVEKIEKNILIEEGIERLSNLKINETAKIVGLSKECRGENRRRLLDLGFVRGATIRIDLLNPLSDPKAFLIKGTAIALRENQSSKILIKKE